MIATKVLEEEKGGFNFENALRNKLLAKKGIKEPITRKTGTTIVGLIYKDGVVLGADTRATSGATVADKNCEKIHYIAKNIWCCGAGTSADTENITGLISSQIELHRLATNEEPRVITALTRLKQRLFQYQGHISAALVLGGVDCTGAHLYTVYPHGSTDRLPYATMGSGSLAAMAEFEKNYKDGLDEKEAINLVNNAIQAGIWNDLGSGGNVDICILRKGKGMTMLRNYRTLNARKYYRQAGYLFPKTTTEWLTETEKIYKHDIDIIPISAYDDEEETDKDKETSTTSSMDTS